MREINAIFTIAFRDFSKLLKDRGRMIGTLVFPFVFVGILGASLQSNLGASAGYNLMNFIFLGVLGQTLFQSTASGIISLIEDRENDFSKEIFVSPVSRYSIIIGKILGETIVAITQALGVLLFGVIMRVPMSLDQLIRLAPAALIICVFGGAFGVFVMSQLKSQRAANQVFPFIIFPQYMLAGVFNPVKELPPLLLILSRLSPMTYAVDLTRAVYYMGTTEFSKAVLYTPFFDLLVIGFMFIIFFFIGTFLFVRNERNR